MSLFEFDPSMSQTSAPGLHTTRRRDTTTGLNRDGGSFAETLKKSINDVNGLQQKANASMQDLATGKRKTLHETMIAVEEADVAFRMLMAVRGKVVNAYQEIMRMHF